jgi:hypothetical protein
VEPRAVLEDLYSRIPHAVEGAVAGLSADDLTWVPVPGANTIGWLAWHLARVEDHHGAELLGTEQRWLEWAARFGLDPDPHDTGYGHTPEQVAGVRPPSAQVLLDYLAAVHDPPAAFVAGVGPADLERIVDERWDPPVTMAVRLVSVAEDALQHAGQAAYLRGLLGR